MRREGDAAARHAGLRSIDPARRERRVRCRPDAAARRVAGLSLDWIFFDAGNTLLGLDYSRLLRALEAEGFASTEDAIRRAEAAARRDLDMVILQRWMRGGLPRTGWIEAQVWRSYWQQVLEICGADSRQADTLVESVLRVTRPASSWTRVEPGTAALLGELAARGHRLGVISNSSGTLTEHLTRLGLADRFEIIVDSAHVGVEKPHPDIFHTALRMAGGASASRALYVGDVYAIDVLGAAGAGLQALLFDPLGLWDAASLPIGMPECRTIGSLEALRDELRGAG